MRTHSMRRRSTRPLGVILYQGPSRVDGKPIVMIATFSSLNSKTGNMIQTWILLAEIPPIEAVNTGDDASICGDCPLRGFIDINTNRDRGCYVKFSNAPRAVYDAFKRKRYEYWDKEKHARYFEGRTLRLGAYGDPVAVPIPIWKRVLPLVVGHTGYSHQWKRAKFQRWSKYVMASTHSLAENELARHLGWRSFRTRTADQPIASDEVMCPASNEAGKRLTCETCLACGGGQPQQRSIVIIGHGSPAVLASVNKVTRN